jgi:hypothetical protein
VEGSDGDSGSAWFLWVNDTEFGPIDIVQLRTLKEKGLLQPDHWVRGADNEKWIPAASIQNLFAAAPPPLPTQAEELSAQNPEDRDLSATEGVAAHSGHRRRNYFARHWKGELSLPVSYWVNGFLGNAVAAVIILSLSQYLNFKTEFRPEIALAVVTTIWTTVLLVAVWQIVGVWRSATNYSKKNIRSYWGGVAKFMACLAVLRIAYQFATAAIPQITEFAKIYNGDDEVGKYEFRVLNSGQELEFAGGITFGAAKAFERFSDALPSLRTVRLTSIGGRIFEAQLIAAQIKKRDLNTYAPNYCISACTIIFLNGRERFMNPGSRIGFHQPDFPGVSNLERRELIATERARLTSLGVSPAFADKVISTPPSQVWYPTTAELLAEHVATKVLDLGDSRVASDRFTSKEGNFSVNFNGLPKLKKETGVTVKDDVTYDSYTWSLTGVGSYKAVALFIYSKTLSFSYDGAISGAATNSKSTVVSQKNINLNGIDGRDVLFSASDTLQMRTRMFFKNDRFYQIIFVGKPEEVVSSETTAFLGSFRIE